MTAFKPLVTLVLAGLLLGGGALGMVARRAPEATPVIHGTTEQRMLAERALARFEEAGLELPPGVVVEFRCTSGLTGFVRREHSRWQVEICRAEEWIVAHELAHVWLEANASPEARRALLQHFELAEWGDDARGPVPWAERGSERAAETLRWGVYEGEADHPFHPADVAHLNRGFQIITGDQAPQCRRAGCS